MKIRKYILTLLLLVFAAGCADRDTATTVPGFRWNADRLTVGLETRVTGRINIRVDHAVPEGETGWAMSRLNIPQYWDVSKTVVTNNAIHVTVASAGEYVITETNFPGLKFDLLSNSDSHTEKDVEVIWDRHARRYQQ